MKKDYLKKLAAVSVAAAMVFSMAACGNTDTGNNAGNASESSSAAAENTSKKDNKKLTKITFCLDWTPNTNHTGLYVAQQMGYYEQEGLDVQIVQPPEDGAALMCSAGQAQFAIEAQDTMAASLDSDAPLDITAVAAVLQHNTSGIMSRKGDGIDTPAGMTGKTYSTWESPIELATLETVVNGDGGDFSKVQLIPSMVTDEVTALKTKSVDAIWIFYAWAGVKTEIEGLETDYFAFADLNPVFDFYTPVIIANNDFLEQEPDTARAFMEAVSKGYQDAVKEPEEAADILCKAAPELDPELVKASQIYLADQYQADAERWGYISPDRWNGYYSWLNEKGLVETPIEENTGFSNDYLP